MCWLGGRGSGNCSGVYVVRGLSFAKPALRVAGEVSEAEAESGSVRVGWSAATREKTGVVGSPREARERAGRRESRDGEGDCGDAGSLAGRRGRCGHKQETVVCISGSRSAGEAAASERESCRSVVLQINKANHPLRPPDPPPGEDLPP